MWQVKDEYSNKIYLRKKKELILKLCKKHHVWPYYKKDGHKLCGFDWQKGNKWEQYF